MPRGRKARLSKIPADRAATLFAEHHILGFRYGKTGEILQVKYAGPAGPQWLTPAEYTNLKRVHEYMPLIEKVIEGGYRMKAALWNSYLEVSVVGTGVKLPLGVAFVAGALYLWAERMQQGKEAEAWLILAALVLPFGELLLIAEGAVDVGAALDNFKKFLADVDAGVFPLPGGTKAPVVRVVPPRAWWRAIFPWP